jgi:hypothetical protein
MSGDSLAVIDQLRCCKSTLVQAGMTSKAETSKGLHV